MLKKYLEKIKSSEIDIDEHYKKILDSCKRIDEEFFFFNTLLDDAEIKRQVEIIKKKIKQGTSGKLSGLMISVKDNICVKDVESTAGSKILKSYKPLFDATVIERLKQEGAIVLGKTSCDAFGFGSFNINVGLDFKIPKHPLDKERVTGGSSGGSAGITAKLDSSHVSIVEGTGGSIECPASFCGVVGFCPSYGLISRHGLISYANSLDKIGLMSKKVDDLIPVLEVIAGYDKKDSTTIKRKISSRDFKKKTLSSLKIGIIQESLDVEKGISKDVKEVISKVIDKLKKDYSCEFVSLPITFKYGVPTYYTLSMSEASTNLSKYSGLRYGLEKDPTGKTFSEYFTEIRSEYFNDETKRRILLGTFTRMAGFRDDYYIKATKIRTKIIDEYKKLFEKYDILISPTMPIVAPKYSEVKRMSSLETYMMDILTVGPNLTGMPHATVPVGKLDGLPVGLMAISDHFEEDKLISFLRMIEKFYVVDD